MLMITHKSDIDHILHDLEQIELAAYDDTHNMNLVENSKVKAHEVTEELMALLHELEAEEWMNKRLAYDPKMIEDMCMIAYYMSFYNWNDLALGAQSIEETSILCADAIGCHPMSIINMKTIYDDYIYSIENNWAKHRVLPEDMKFIMGICDGMEQDEVLHSCLRILGQIRA